MTKGCLGFEDQNGKKVAISGSTSLEAFRSISENSLNTTPTVVVSSTKAGVTRGSSNAAANRKINNSNVADSVTQSTPTRPVGKKRKGKRWCGLLVKRGFDTGSNLIICRYRRHERE